MYYLLPLTLFFFAIPAFVGDKNVQRYSACFLLVTFSLFCGLRWYVDADFRAYVEIYDLVPFLADFNLKNTVHIHSEVGYKFLNSFFKSLSLDSYILFFFIASVSLYSKFRFYLKYTGNVFFCFAFYLALNFITFEFIQIRMGLAAAVLCVALHYYFINKTLLSVSFIVLASTIHSISMVFLLISLIKNIKLKYLLSSALFLIVTSSSFNFVDFLIPNLLNVFDSGILLRASNYVENEKFNNAVTLLNLTPLRHFLVLIWIFLLFGKLEKIDETNTKVLKIYVLGVMVSSLFMEVEILYARVQFIFDIVEPMVICLLILMMKDFRLRLGLFIGVGAIVFSLMLKGVHSNMNIDEYTTWLGLIF